MTDSLHSRAGFFHVAGVVVQSLPGSAESVAQCISQIPGALAHAISGDGKLVVTVESGVAHDILAQLTAFQHLNGVMPAVLVSEHSEPASLADEVIVA
jgi:periplasmic nitrate reductase NapD